MDKDLSVAERRKAEKKERKKLKNELLEQEALATCSVELEKGEWQFPACSFLTPDNQSYGCIPYDFLSASKSHSSFRSQLYLAAKNINSTLDFGVAVGGSALVFSEKENLWVKKYKQQRSVMRFWSRGSVAPQEFTKRPIRTDFKEGGDDFNFKIDSSSFIRPGTELPIRDGCIGKNGAIYDLKVTVRSRAIAFCINRFEEGAKSICFGLMPYSMISSEFIEHYTNAFDLLGQRLGKVSHGFIIEIDDKSSRKKKLFSTLTILDDQRIKILFYDYKSPVNAQLSAYLRRKTSWKVDSWKGKRKSGKK